MHIVARSLVCASLLAAAAACNILTGGGDEDGPPQGSEFDPGKGGGDGYGSGSGANVIECPADLKRCAHTVTFPYNGENKVEIRGDFGGQSTWDAGTPMVRKGNVWTVDISVPFDKPVQYKFRLNDSDKQWVCNPDEPNVEDGFGGCNNTLAPKTCAPVLCEDEGALPEGVYDWRDSVIYFPMVDRFFNSDGRSPCRVDHDRVTDLANYKGGDWKGITQKINEGYFDDLGVNTLWLSVTADNALGAYEGVKFNAGKWFTGYHGYWPQNLDPKTPFRCFAANEEDPAGELKELIATAHDKNMKVLVDYAMVHAHTNSSLWNDHRNWFWTRDGNPYPNCDDIDGWEVFSESNGNVFWDPNREGNKCWFAPYLAHWNYSNPEARKFVVDNVIDWFKEYGFDGMRLDAVKHVDMQWTKDVRTRVNQEILPTKKAGERVYLLGETFADTKPKLKVHVNPGTMLDGQFDFVLQPTVQDVLLRRSRNMHDLARSVMESETYGGRVIMSTFVGNHDQERSIRAAGGENADGYERLANAYAVILTVKGAPSILYGDEVGLDGGPDPDVRRMMKFDGELSSLQKNLKARVAKLAKIRNEHPALRRGTRQTLVETDDVWLFRMSTGSTDRVQDTVYVAINRSDGSQDVDKLPGGELRELVEGGSVSGARTSIPPRQTRIFVAK